MDLNTPCKIKNQPLGWFFIDMKFEFYNSNNPFVF